MIIHRHSHIHHKNANIFSEKMPTTIEYIQSLEEERKKIQVFQRELPLCLQLVTQAIEECKQRLLEKENECNFRGHSECSEQTSTEGPVLEQFIPLKKTSSSSDHRDDDDDDEHQSQHSEKVKAKDNKNNDKSASKKSDWLRSVQLWNHTPDPPPTQMESPKRVSVMEVRRNGSGGAFHPFKKDTTVGPTPPVVIDSRASAPAAAASSTAETGGGGKSKKEEREGQCQRKNRRCWSPELHKRFLQALQQLGGSNVATPKQIRELMKVDGLTNDEVKSHLQKYRLHHRRPSSSIHNHHHQQPQFVVVGGLWVPPPDYAAMTTTSSGEEATANAASNGIYTPIAALATPFQDASLSEKPKQQEREPSHSAGHDSNCSHGGVDSHASTDSSSSTDTTPTSPNY